MPSREDPYERPIRIFNFKGMKAYLHRRISVAANTNRQMAWIGINIEDEEGSQTDRHSKSIVDNTMLFSFSNGQSAWEWKFGWDLRRALLQYANSDTSK